MPRDWTRERERNRYRSTDMQDPPGLHVLFGGEILTDDIVRSCLPLPTTCPACGGDMGQDRAGLLARCACGAVVASDGRCMDLTEGWEDEP